MRHIHARLASDDSLLISIKLADGSALRANRHLLFAVSVCASGLAADAAEWDLSQFVVEGQAVTREVVVAWLHAAHQCIHHEPYGEEAQQDPPLACSVAGLAQLLAFADAVGSSKGLLAACLSELGSLEFHVQAGEQQLRLDTAGAYLWEGDELQIMACVDESGCLPDAVAEVTGEDAKAALAGQVAEQLEALLFVAHKLQLERVVGLLHTFIFRNINDACCLLREAGSSRSAPAFERVLSARVLDAAAGASPDSQLAFVNNIITQPCSLVPSHVGDQLLEPTGPMGPLAPIRFKAKLMQDFLVRGSKGKTVNVVLDLFGTSEIIIGDMAHSVRLHIGVPLSKAGFSTLSAASGVPTR